MVDGPPSATALSIRIDMRHVPSSTYTSIVYLGSFTECIYT